MDSTITPSPELREPAVGAGDLAPLAAIPAPRTAPDDAPSAAARTEPVGETATAALGEPEEEITEASIYRVTAAGRSGGLMRGNLAVLIRYWTRGEGAAKVGWGRSGDLVRCFRLLARYVPPNQVKGFCARLHKRATGKWPGPGRGH